MSEVAPTVEAHLKKAKPIMTDPSPDQPADDAATPTERTPGNEGSDTVDMMLYSLVVAAQTTEGFEFGVTLTVRGATVTGTLVGRNEWLQRMHASLGGRPGSLSAQWVELLSFDPEAEPDREELFIHLADARTVSGSGAVPSYGVDGGLWRGLLASVDGWSIGHLGASE